MGSPASEDWRENDETQHKVFIDSFYIAKAETTQSEYERVMKKIRLHSALSKILIAYFSWGGNTRGIAQEIAKQTGADIFEIEPKVPYSSDYSTVLKQAQEDQDKTHDRN